MIAETQTTQTTLAIAIINSHQSALKYVDSCCVLLLSAYARRDCVRRLEFRLTTYKMLALNIAVGLHFLWPIWLFLLADMVFSCGRCNVVVADMKTWLFELTLA